MACKYIYNNVEYKDKQTFIEEFVKPNFINQPKTLRLQELQQPDFLKFIRKDKDYLKSQGLTNEEVDFLNLLFAGDEKWVTFFIKSVIQDAAKKGYEKVLFPKGDTASKVEGHSTLEEFKKQKEDRIKELEILKQSSKPVETFYIIVDSNNIEYGTFKTEQEAINNIPNDLPLETFEIKKQDIVTKETYQIEINQLKQELERVETEGFGALKPIYNFYENTVGNILNKQFGKENVKLITDEYGNTWNEIDLSSEKVKQQTDKILFQSPKLQYTGDLAIEEKIAEEAENSKDEIVAKTPLQKFIQSIKNLLRNIFKERDKVSRLLRDMNQGRLNSDNKYNINQNIKYQLSKEQSDAIDNVFDENPELAEAIYEALGFNENNFELKENKEAFGKEPHPEGVTAYDIFSNGRKIGKIALFEGKNPMIKGVNLDESERNKGLGKALYKWLNYKATLKGGRLYADQEYISPNAQRVWESLSKEGLIDLTGVSPKFNDKQKQQAISIYSQYLESLNKPNTNPILQGNQKPDVILPIGTSGSGKSTFIKSLPQENLVVIEPDAMRVEFTGNMNDKSKDKEIYEEAAKRAVQAIKQGKQVVFDTTNLTKDKRLPFIEAIKKAIPDANIQYKLMELNPELAKQRIKADIAAGKNRANVPDATIDRHAESYTQMLEDIKSEPISNFDVQEEQVKKFAELQERLNNKEFLEGAKNAFESSEELQNVYYDSLDEDKFEKIFNNLFINKIIEKKC